MSALPAIQWGLIAGIVDPQGGSRVIFADDPISISANVVYAKGERAFVAPGWKPMSYEPVEIADAVVQIAEKAMEGDNPCGTCRACCIVPELSEGDEYKAAYTPCRHLCATGCGIYERRPTVCKRFECLWLTSQHGNQAMRPELRPDRCGAFLCRNSLKNESDERIEIHRVKDCWKTDGHLQNFLEDQQRIGRKPVVVTHYTRDGLK